jgi:hypothetical protein
MVRPIIAATAVALALAACKPAPEPDTAAPAATAQARIDAETADQAASDTPPADPVDAYIWRVDRCVFSSGEIKGDGSPADRDTMARMEALDCGDNLKADGEALRAVHAGDAATIARIDQALQSLDQ